MKALLFSGGLDSSALAWGSRPDLCVTVNYGQRAARGELAASTALCREMKLPHRTLSLDMSGFGSGWMAGSEPVKMASAPEFWPYRNQMLITVAAMALLPQGLRELVVGSVSTDSHADGSPEFVRTVDRLLRMQEGEVSLTAPAIGITSAQLLRTTGFPAEFLGLTFSCHVHEYACGQCAGCLKHREVVEAVFGASANSDTDKSTGATI